MPKWKSLDTLPPDRTVILRIVENSGEPVWSRPAYVDEFLVAHALDGNDKQINSDICTPSHWMDLPSVELDTNARH